MGFVRAFKGAIGGTLGDQWVDFYAPKDNLSVTAAVFPGVARGTNKNRGANINGNGNVISNGSKVVVPEGTALVTMQDGAITNVITEAGGYIYNTNDPNAKSIFAGDGFVDTIVKGSWNKFRYGAIPSSQQTLFYVNLKEIPNNKFGTQSEIYWDDAFFGTQVGAIARGTYTLRIIDPILFLRNFAPQAFLLPGAKEFDFSDMDNPASEQLFNEVVGSLSAAFSNYTNDPSMRNRMSKIQGDQIGFAKSLSAAVEDNYNWKSTRGLEIVKTAIMAIEYDEDTKALMSDVKKADALSGNRGNSFFQQAAARGMQAAGENGGGANMAFMGMGMNASGNMMGATQQPNTTGTYNPSFNQQPQVEDPTDKLLKMKKLLDAGAITQEEYDKVNKKILDI